MSLSLKRKNCDVVDNEINGGINEIENNNTNLDKQVEVEEIVNRPSKIQQKNYFSSFIKCEEEEEDDKKEVDLDQE